MWVSWSNLTLDDVDMKSCQIRIQHAKFGKWRDIGFGRETHKFLTRYLSVCRPEPAVMGDRHLFLCLDAYPMLESTVQHICRRLSQRVGIHIHAHRFRHTFAVNMLRAGTGSAYLATPHGPRRYPYFGALPESGKRRGDQDAPDE